MPQFMVLILENEAEEQMLAPWETKVLLQECSAYDRKLRAVSAYVDGERLRPSSEGRRASKYDGQLRIDAGPFADKAITGYYVIEAERLDAAIALAQECPLAPNTELDVRPLLGGKVQPDKTSRQGRSFSFAVLGNAPNEQGWSEVMDRIDASTRDSFPIDRFLGGVRLQAPGRGRRVTSVGGRRAVFDGPFMESKEVVGGLFFLRMASLEEAIHWSTQSDFVTHGTLEIRELWRC